MTKNIFSQFDKEAIIGQRIGFFELPWSEDSSGNKPAGKLMIYEPPLYIMFPSPAAKKSGVGGQKAADAANPTAGTDNNELEVIKHSRVLGDAFAETVLYQRLFAQRKGSITGRFRLDIAPGSLIQLNSVGARFTDEYETLFGHVQSVTLEGGTGGGDSTLSTSFELTNMRTAAEHENFTVEYHPIFQLAWNGGRLTDKDGG